MSDANQSTNWQSVATAPKGVMVMTKIDDADGVRNVCKLRNEGRLWFTSDDCSFYVYYSPTHWRHLP